MGFNYLHLSVGCGMLSMTQNSGNPGSVVAQGRTLEGWG